MPQLTNRPRWRQEGFTVQATAYGLQSTVINNTNQDEPSSWNCTPLFPLLKLAEEDWDTDTEYCIISQQQRLDHSGMRSCINHSGVREKKKIE